ncbi:MAG: hypothetical protein J1F67_11750 [Muribaculaceae bacterium]|nr:hypothetical protein [Muribaculaceae bacterium]
MRDGDVWSQKEFVGLRERGTGCDASEARRQTERMDGTAISLSSSNGMMFGHKNLQEGILYRLATSSTMEQ